MRRGFINLLAFLPFSNLFWFVFLFIISFACREHNGYVFFRFIRLSVINLNQRSNSMKIILGGKGQKIMKMVQEHETLFTCKLMPNDVTRGIDLSDNYKLFSKKLKNQLSVLLSQHSGYKPLKKNMIKRTGIHKKIKPTLHFLF